MAEQASSVLVEIDRLSKSFGEKIALEDVTFNVPTGQIFGLLGPNGAGKTTLFRLLMGILKPTSGTLRVGGLDGFEDRVDVKRIVGFLPDEPVFYSYLSGREILELSAGMHGLAARETLERFQPLIERLALAEAMSQFADDYSRGMKKKLGLLLALLHDPKLLILDEPTNGMDVESTRLFYELMREKAEAGTTVLFSTHLMDQVSRLCTDVAVIHRGRLVATGGIEDLRARFGAEATLEDVFVHLTSNEPGPGV